jgi:hypothetical protein
MRFSTSIIVATIAASVSAQSASQIAAAAALAAQIPECAKKCDDAGITSVGCSLTDYACHCAHGSQLALVIPPCLKNSTCTTSDLQGKFSYQLQNVNIEVIVCANKIAAFGAIPAQICAALNSTASANSTTTTSSAKGSGSATATPSGPTASGSATTAGSGASATASGSAGMNVASTLFTVAGVGIMGIFLGGV